MGDLSIRASGAERGVNDLPVVGDLLTVDLLGQGVNDVHAATGLRSHARPARTRGLPRTAVVDIDVHLLTVALQRAACSTASDISMLIGVVPKVPLLVRRGGSVFLVWCGTMGDASSAAGIA